MGVASQTEVDPALVATVVELRKRSVQRKKEGLLHHQRWPAGSWYQWLFMGGRGSGKTFAGGDACMDHLREYGEDAYVIILAPTIPDARGVCIEGPSGIWTRHRDELHSYNKSLLTLRHVGGGHVRAFGAENPDRLRGPQSSFLWVDEVAVVGQEAFDNAMFGLRLGRDPRGVFTTTPRKSNILKRIIEGKSTVTTHATIYDNPHLSQRSVEEMTARYGGTSLGRQELLGEIVEEVEGALWKMAWIDDHRVTRTALPDLVRVVVAIDPAVSSGEDSNETGITVAGLGEDGHYYILFVGGFKLSPRGWATRSIDLFHEFDADKIIGENNNGGEMVESTMRQEWSDVPFKMVYASRGKRTRAEPVALLYEKGHVHHVGTFPSAEDQLITFPVENEQDDQLDSLVWAVTELMGPKKKKLMIGRGKNVMVAV